MGKALKLYFDTLKVLKKGGIEREPTVQEFLNFCENAKPYLLIAEKNSWKVSVKGLMEFNKIKEEIENVICNA